MAAHPVVWHWWILCIIRPDTFRTSLWRRMQIPSSYLKCIHSLINVNSMRVRIYHQIRMSSRKYCHIFKYELTIWQIICVVPVDRIESAAYLIGTWPYKGNVDNSHVVDMEISWQTSPKPLCPIAEFWIPVCVCFLFLLFLSPLSIHNSHRDLNVLV